MVRTNNAKSQGLVPAHFALIIIIVVYVVKSSISNNKYMQKAGELENDVQKEAYLLPNSV